MASLIANSWIYSTVLIENDWNETGTGFLVQRKITDDQAKAFLVTNKHVINSDALLRGQAQELLIGVNMYQPDGDIIGEKGSLPLRYANGTRNWREHPDPDTDVLVVDATNLIIHFPQLAMKVMDYSVIADSAKLKQFDITIGEDVLVIGYPIGLTQGSTNHPIARAGIIATQIGELFEDEVEESGHIRRRKLKGFLIDGATVPGSSGSPVILRPVSGRIVSGTITHEIPPPLLLGIVAETKYAPVKTERWDSYSFAGLGLAFDGETIIEAIELFFQKPTRVRTT